MNFLWLFWPNRSRAALPPAHTATAAQKLMMLSSDAVCRLVELHFEMRRLSGREVNPVALAKLSDRLGTIAHMEARRQL